jgi:ABC-type antimicrobial peptide transport system permease subunit
MSIIAIVTESSWLTSCLTVNCIVPWLLQYRLIGRFLTDEISRQDYKSSCKVKLTFRAVTVF